MDDLEIFERLGLALAIGLLLGVERGWRLREQSSGARVAGVRTFALIGLFGGMSGWLAQIAGAYLIGFFFLGFAALIVASYFIGVREDKDVGVTTEIAALLTFVLGAAAVMGEMAPAAAGAVVATALLALKSALHRWIEQLRRFELIAAIELAIISVVLLPLLPDRGFGPFGALNPYALWWAVVLVAGLSFFGHVAIRGAGAQVGTLVTGVLGGLASSTATTLAFARLARSDAALAPVLAVGAVLAGSVTFLRVLAVASVFNAALVQPLAAPLGIMAATGFLGALALRLGGANAGGGEGARPEMEEMTNPLDLGMAVKFAALLAAVIVAVEYFRLWFGAAGVFAVAALSGVTDVDAVTISMARMAGADFAPVVAAQAIVLAVSVNTAVKAGVALAAGGPRIGYRVSAVYAAVLAAGGLAVWLG